MLIFRNIAAGQRKKREKIGEDQSGVLTHGLADDQIAE
jgi:hypothetical protein